MDHIEYCPWLNIFNENDHFRNRYGHIWSASVAAMMGLITNILILMHPSMKYDLSYRNLARFTMIAFMRRTTYLVYIFLLNEYDFYVPPMWMAGFESFSAMMEIEHLAHICIERFVVSRFVINGWPIKKNLYTIFFIVCLFFSTTCSLPPVRSKGFDFYDFDFDCKTYTLSMLLRPKWANVICFVYVMRSFKPLLIMVVMLQYCWTNEKMFMDTPENRKRIEFTKTVAKVTLVTMLTYTPIFVIRGKVIWQQLLSSDNLILPTADTVMWASWLHWISPALTAVTLFVVDKRFNDAVMNTLYTLIPCYGKRNNATNGRKRPKNLRKDENITQKGDE